MQIHTLNKSKNIPVIKSKEQQVLLFSTEVQSLRKYLFQYYHSVAHTFKGETKEHLNSYFYKINAISQTDMTKLTTQEVNEFLHESHLSGVTRHRHPIEEHKGQENLSIREFNEESYHRNPNPDIEGEHEPQSEVDLFWSTPIDWEHECIEVDRAPFTMMTETPLAKIHFLFTMLNVSQIYVINEGFLVGIITKNEFLKRRLNEDHREVRGFISSNIEHKPEGAKTERKESEDPHELHFEGRELRGLGGRPRKASL